MRKSMNFKSLKGSSMNRSLFTILIFAFYSCEDSCQKYEKIDSGDRCLVLRGLNDLNKEGTKEFKTFDLSSK